MSKYKPPKYPAVIAYSSREELIAAREKARNAQVKRTSLENLHQVFLKMGGIKGMYTWAKENPTEFYKIWSKILPKEVINTHILNDANGDSMGVNIFISGQMSEAELYDEFVGDDAAGDDTLGETYDSPGSK